jgi:hypothetical protein
MMMKDVIYLGEFPITPNNSVCKCTDRHIVVQAEGGGLFHAGCGKFIPSGKK